ncbi:MAG: hypothetical protein H0T78_04765, partial [Longispora sp.]|nr:hypothetical protein [Longispora sp. (in: high G+C Gram-positive bacteria)]
MITPCPECSGQRVSAPLYGDASIGRGNWPIRHVTELRCLVCLSCGHTALYASDVGKLRRVVARHPKQFDTNPDATALDPADYPAEAPETTPLIPRQSDRSTPPEPPHATTPPAECDQPPRRGTGWSS